MEITFAETMKSLRKSRGNTQEELASHLGISVQAVSKWERGDGMPDIMLLPHIAAFYDTTVDELLGCGLIQKQTRIQNFVQEYRLLHSQGKTAERLALSRAMQKVYPNDETVLYHLMRALQNGYIDESFDEIITLGEKLLRSTNLEYRAGAIRGLCFTYLRVGDRKNALRYADMMPPANDLHLHVLEGDELVEHCQNYFWKVCDMMYLYMNYLVKCPEAGYTHDETHTAWKTLYDMFHAIFPDRDFGFWEERLAKISFFMSVESIQLGHTEQALQELEDMLSHVEAMKDFHTISHSSLLVNRIKIGPANIAKSSEETLARSLMKYLDNKRAVFLPLEDHPRFLHIKERLSCI